MTQERKCGDAWRPDLPMLADVVCDRTLPPGRSRHTGKHLCHDENGDLRMSWWGGAASPAT